LIGEEEASCGIKAILDSSNREKLLPHPLVASYLALKWDKIFSFAFMIWFLWLVLMASSTVVAIWIAIEKRNDAIQNGGEEVRLSRLNKYAIYIRLSFFYPD